MPRSRPRGRKHRRWSAEEKRSICQQARAPGVSVAQVARRYALNANLIFKWLRDARFAPAVTIAAEPVLLPVDVRGDDMRAVPPLPKGGDAGGRVAIILAAGHRVTLEGPFDGEAMARLLTVLTRA